jgi:hypothetical protein
MLLIRRCPMRAFILLNLAALCVGLAGVAWAEEPSIQSVVSQLASISTVPN